MLQEIYNRLDKEQLSIFIFWSLCVFSFSVIFLKIVLMVIKENLKIN